MLLSVDAGNEKQALLKTVQMSIRPGGNYYEMKCLSLSYRLCCSVSPRTDVAQSIMSSISGVDGLPGHPHAERSFFIDLHASHPVPRS